MKFAVQWGGAAIAPRVATTKLAEEAGFDIVGYGGVGTWPVMIGAAGPATSRVRLSTAITEPLTHHPVMAATAASALQELCSGRFILTYATGDSIAKRLGRPPATISHLRDHVLAVRELLAGREADFQGRRCFLSAGSVRWEGCDVPLWLSAAGPRALRLAGEIADGILANVGLAPDAIAGAKTLVAEGAAERPQRDEREMWFFTIALVNRDGDYARDQVRGIVASSAHMAFQKTLEGKAVPDELAEAVRQFVRGYDVRYHGSPGNTPNAQLMDELGLTDWLLQRFAVAGDPDQCCEQISHLREAGIESLWVSSHDLDDTLDLWGREVIPEFT
jgi:5,10-methylenetetrahydromethanopterin reductase